MSICPCCQANIDVLVSELARRTGFKVEDGKPVYDEGLIGSSADKEESYACPECWDVIVDTEEQAVRFLTGELVIEPYPKPKWDRPTTRLKRKPAQMELVL